MHNHDQLVVLSRQRIRAQLELNELVMWADEERIDLDCLLI